MEGLGRIIFGTASALIYSLWTRRPKAERSLTSKERLQSHPVSGYPIDEGRSWSPRQVAVGGILPVEPLNDIVGPAGLAIAGLAGCQL